MIGFLKGSLAFKSVSHVFVDVSGVGYKVLVPQSVLTMKVGNSVMLFTYTHVREDILELYGFSTQEDLVVFEQLISVSGVGPKTALGVFAIGSSDAIKRAIISGDVSFFTGVPRLGKKNAQKIIIELKNRLTGLADMSIPGEDSEDMVAVIDALKAFGFTPQEAAQALKKVDKTLSIEDKIRYALKALGK